MPNVGLRKTVVTGTSGGVGGGFTVVRLAFMFPPALRSVMHRMPTPGARSNKRPGMLASAGHFFAMKRFVARPGGGGILQNPESGKQRLRTP
jgi:hypothetical protein